MPAAVRLSADTISGMLSDYESGQSFRALAARHGCAKSTVRKHLLAAGATPNLRRSQSRSMTGRPSPRRGVTLSAETIAKMVATRRVNGKKVVIGAQSAQHRANISASLKGKRRRFSDEERLRREAVRQACKRFVRRILLATGARKTGTVQQIVGYSKAELCAHLGVFPSGYHIDHYVPVVEFFRRGIFEPAVINALPNLRAIPADENRRKSASVPADADDVVALCISFDPQMRGQVLTKVAGGYRPGL